MTKPRLQTTDINRAINNLKPPTKKVGNKVYDSSLEGEISRLKNRTADLEKQLKNKDDTIKSLTEQTDELEKKLEKKAEASNKLTIEREKTINDIKRKSVKPLDQMVQEENESLRNEMKASKMENAELKNTIDGLKLRISKIAGDRMTDGNTSITDMSDSNRPQKLSEKFVNLYDNVWTDVFEEYNTTTNDEKASCQNLLFVFKRCWEFCQNYAKQQLENIQTSLMFPNITNEDEKKKMLEDYPRENTKLILDTRRCFAQRFIPCLQKLYREHMESQKEEMVEKSLESYVDACLELCWHCAITDPPLYYSFDAENIDDFRGFTKSGDEIDFVVWPAMYLHKYGPLLYKGVVQFKTAEEEPQAGKKISAESQPGDKQELQREDESEQVIQSQTTEQQEIHPQTTEQ